MIRKFLFMSLFISIALLLIVSIHGYYSEALGADSSTDSLNVKLQSFVGGQYNDFVVNENLLAVVGWENVKLYDISNISIPQEISSYYEEGCNFQSVDMFADRVYVTQTNFSCGYHLNVFDSNLYPLLSDPVSISYTGSPVKIQVEDAVVYIAYAQNGLSIVDLTDLENIVVYPNFKAKSSINSHDVVVRGSTAYMPNLTGGFVIIDVSDKGEPVLVADHDFPTGIFADYNSTGIAVSNDIVYLAAGNKGVKAFDVNDLFNISQIQGFEVNGYVRDIDSFPNVIVVASDAVSGQVGGMYAYSEFERELTSQSYLHTEGNNKFYKVEQNNNYTFGLDINNGIYIVAFSVEGDVSGNTEPFLDLPWNYESTGMTFTEAALSMSSYFDHEYPLVSVSSLLDLDKSDLVNFKGNKSIRYAYSSHDGYDWGRIAGTKYGTPQVAAAGGIASYVNTCKACGNAIYIDHENGFQTRYYHLQNKDLIVSTPNLPVPVAQGQQIGLTGFSGNTIPRGEQGAHIHFMVVEDKDKDGDFDDDIPGGLVDPFGWESGEPDPWESFRASYKGVEITGSKSLYLWRNQLSNFNDVVTQEGGEIQLSQYKVVFPANAYSETFKVNLESKPVIVLSSTRNSIGPSLHFTSVNSNGENITQFNNPFTLYFDFNKFDLSEYDFDSLAIYSSSDGQNWIEENTIVNNQTKIAYITADHLTDFALFADRLDTVSPDTQLVLSGEEGDKNWFRTNIQISFKVNDTLSDIAYTAYSVNNSEWREYTEPISFSQEGEHVIRYYSEDSAGNVEEQNEQHFAIDKNTPEVKIQYNVHTGNIDLTPYYATEKVAEVIEGRNRYLSVTDLAGNELRIEGRYKLTDKGKYLSIQKLAYNDVVYGADINKFSVNDNEGKLFQSWLTKDFQIRLSYPYNDSQTRIHMNTSGVQGSLLEEGEKLLFLSTNKGKIHYGYQ